MNKQSKGYPRYQNKTSIFFDWLQAQPDPRKARFPSGHLARKQNKYLQLSSSLFGDQEERDRIRGSREEANKDYLLRQEKETEYYAKQQREEDERLFADMSLGPSKGNRVSNTYPSSQKSSKGSYQPSFLDTEHKSQRSVSENSSNGTHKKSELQSRSLESGFVQPTSTSRLQEIKTANPSNQPRPKNPNPNPHSQDLKLPVSHPKGIPHLVYLQPHPSYSKSAHRPQPPANYPLAFQYPPIDEGGNNLSYPPPVVYLLPQQPPPPVYPQVNSRSRSK